MLDDPLKPGGAPPWWVERVTVWTEVPSMAPWRVDGFPPDTTDQEVIGFWYGCLRTFLQVRGEVQQEEIRDKDLRERRAERDKHKGSAGKAYESFDPNNPEDQDPEGDWEDQDPEEAGAGADGDW